jgi:hypothetical protein
MPRKTAAGARQGSVLAPELYSRYFVNDAPAAPGSHLALFADDTCICVTEEHKRRVLCKLQRRLTAVNSWCERWNLKINERKSQTICFSRRRSFPDDILHSNRRDIPFINNVSYLVVTFDRRIAWRHHNERTIAKALRTYVRTYSLFRSLRFKYKRYTYTFQISDYVNYDLCLSNLGVCGGRSPLEIHRLENRAFSAIGNLDMCSPVIELHVAFLIPYVYGYTYN